MATLMNNTFKKSSCKEPSSNDVDDDDDDDDNDAHDTDDDDDDDPTIQVTWPKNNGITRRSIITKHP